MPYDEVWWKCPKCGQVGGFCGEASPAMLYGLCVPAPGRTHEIFGHNFSAVIDCHSCGWAGTWYDAKAFERIAC